MFNIDVVFDLLNTLKIKSEKKSEKIKGGS